MKQGRGVSDHAETSWCPAFPYPFEARYDDGKPLLRVHHFDQDNSTEWRHFDPFGRLILVEQRTPELAHYVAYYFSGKKRLEGEALFDKDQKQFLADGEWVSIDESETLRAHALLRRGTVTSSASHQWDEGGREVPWSLPAETFRITPHRVSQYAEPRYPRYLRERSAEGEVCSLVCLDERGKLRGVFILNQSDEEFGKAVIRALERSRYEPRKLGDVAIPDCFTISYKFRMLFGEAARVR